LGPPQINGFSVNSPITVGGNVVLNLATSNADHCYLTNGGSALYTSGEVNPNGSSTLGPANSPGSYYEYLYCRNPAGTNSPVVGAPFDVIYPPGAVTSFDVQPREINSGGGVNVSWASANTSSCSGTGSLPSWTAGGNPTPGRPTSGSLGIASIGNEGPAPIPYTASIECSNANGGIAYGREINVTVKPALPRLVTSVSTSTLGGGQTFSFSWDSSGSAKSCLPIGTLPGWQGGASTQSSGTVNVTAPTTDGNYTIGMQCSNDSGSVDSSQTVSVSAACFVYMALAQNPASPSDNWCYYFECATRAAIPTPTTTNSVSTLPATRLRPTTARRTTTRGREPEEHQEDRHGSQRRYWVHYQPLVQATHRFFRL